MARCSKCGVERDHEFRFCPECGAEQLDSGFDVDDVTLHKSAPQARSDSDGSSSSAASASMLSSSSSASFSHGRFIPGMMIGDRYRIVSMLGKGGMGEVYRADDLSVGQQVALKFLPADLAEDPERLERFRQEIRVARQVSHPNVCRVFDIGQVGRDYYISMEYIEGEDLKSLLKRIGQLPESKAVQISRQIAAGLAAAHDRGLVHRDLKPANIMLDERGMVRITDFGLAAPAEDLSEGGAREGTPQYMAPEQFTGGAITPATDIYALGLVMFELFTGRRAFDAGTLAELIDARESSNTSTISEPLESVDRAIERVILRCLEKDPGKRPQSVLAVSAALPGGDPLAAALAAGETPSPEMVAAAGDETVISVRGAMIALIAGLILIVLTPVIGSFSGGSTPEGFRYTPEVMAAKARDLVAQLGYEAEPAGTANGYYFSSAHFDFYEENEEGEEKWSRIADYPYPLHGFWYRESLRDLVNFDFYSPSLAGGATNFSSPREAYSGEVKVLLDRDGRLWGLNAVPPQVSEGGPTAESDPFDLLLEAAGLDESEMTEVEPEWSPPHFATDRRAWETELAPGLPMRVEAAAYYDLPVYLSRIFPWTQPQRMNTEPATALETLEVALQILVFFLVVGGALLLARRNVVSGRGDRRGAFRLAIASVVLMLMVWVTDADHVAAPSEFGLLIIALAWSAIVGFGFWAIYIAIEPIMRRRWPEILISWSRLITAGPRDPMVGRDVLLGTVAGIAMGLVGSHGGHLLRRIVGEGLERPAFFDTRILEGIDGAVAWVLTILLNAMLGAFFLTFLLVLFLMLFRKRWIAIGLSGALAVLISAVNIGTGGGGLARFAMILVVWFLILWVLTRFGLLATTILILVGDLSAGISMSFPNAIGVAPAAAVFPILLLLVFVGFGFVYALGGRQLFSEELIEGS